MPKNVGHVDVMLFIAGVLPVGRLDERTDEWTDGRTYGSSVLRPFVLPKSDAVDLASVRTSKEHFEALHIESIRYLLPVAASSVLLRPYSCEREKENVRASVCVCVFVCVYVCVRARVNVFMGLI